MKNKFTNAVIAAASTFFVVGAIAEKSQVKDLGLGIFLATSMVKQQRVRQDCHRVGNSIDDWQQNILTEVASLSRSLEKTEQKLSQVDSIADNQKLDRALEQITKIENRLATQEKQQNKMRSLLDKLKHQMKTEIEKAWKSQSGRKNFDRLAQPNKITTQLIEQQPTTHIYIDGNNLKCSAHKLNLDIDYGALKSFLMPDNGKIRLNFYHGACQASKGFHFYLNRLGYIVNALPKRTHSDGTDKTIGDDTSIVIDIFDKVKAGDRLILISGDGDFFPVLEKMQQRWVKVTAIASEASVSDLILKKADKFISLEKLPELIATNNKFAVA